MAVNFALLGDTPNFAQSALSGYQAGHAVGQEQRRGAALALYAKDPAAGITALLPVDPALSETLQKNADRQALRAVFTPEPGAGVPTQATAPALGATPPSATSASATPPPITPAGAAALIGGAHAAAPLASALIATGTPPAGAPATAAPVSLATHGPQINKAALDRLYATDPDTAFKLQQHLSQLSKDQLAQEADKQDTLASAFLSLAQIPAGPQREAARQQLAQSPQLAAHGITPQEAMSAPIDDQSLHASTAMSLGVKGMIEQQNKEIDQAEKGRHNKADEGLSAEGHAIQMRGQNMTAATAAAGRAVTVRGQNLTDARAKQSFQGAADPLDQTAIGYVADQYRNTGQIPALGMGKAAASMRAAIIGEAARRDQAEGITGADASVNHANYAANKTALATISRTNSNILAFEDTANRNADYVLSTATKGAGTTGVPLFNAWQQAGRRSIGGNPDVSRFDVAVKTFANEYAKVTSGASGGSVTSDSARHEIDGLINAAQTPAQLRAVIGQAKVEMANRRAALQDQRSALTTQLRGHADAPRQSGTLSPRKLVPATSGWSITKVGD